jgi:hypothetical protein
LAFRHHATVEFTRTQRIVVGCLCLVLAAIGTGCRQKKYTARPEGRLIADTYTNSFFGCSLKIPANWSVLNRAEIENPPPPTLLKRERNPFTGQSFTVPDVELYNLITLVERTNLFPDATITAMAATNLALSVMCQNVSWNSAVHDGRDYLTMVKNIFEILAAPGRDLKFDGPSEVLVGGKKFYRDTFRGNAKNSQASWRVYSRVDHGYGFIFVLSAPTEAQLDQAEPLMATVRFD